MSNVLTIIAGGGGPPLDDSTAEAAREALVAAGAEARAPDWLAPGTACDIVFAGLSPEAARIAAARALGGAPIDLVAQPLAGRRKRLLVADMESTVIANEFVDELAEAAGIGAAVAAITRRAVAGEIEFAAALRERVALLEGLSTELFDRVYAGLAVTPGAAALVRTMRANGAYAALVSGGFDVFTRRVRDLLGFDVQFANRLATAGGRLVGRLDGPILDRAAKRTHLDRLAAERAIPIAETLAVGDGANDIDMLSAAGLGVAYRAKPAAAAVAPARIDHGDLTALLYLQGYRSDEILG